MERGQAGRRLVGIDLGIASRHSVRVLEADGRPVCWASCVPSVPSLTAVERAALAGAPEGTTLAVVFEPTGPAWMPIAVFFARRGHAVYRVSSAKAADLRRFLRRHAKSNGIDAETLARIPLADPAGLQPLELPGADAAALDRRVRACGRLTQAASEHKTRIKDLVRQLMPVTPLTGDIGTADLAVLEHHADPRALLATGVAELTTLITTVSHHQQGHGRACQWRAAAAAAAELYGDHPAVPYEALAAEVVTEIRLLRAIQAELATHAAARETHYRQAGPGQLARSLPGFAETAPRSWSPRWAGPAGSGTGPGSSLCRARAPGQRDRRDRPQGPVNKQGRALVAAPGVRPGSRHRPQARSLARQDLLPADDRTRRHPPQSLLRRRQPPRRTGMGRTQPQHPYVICDNNGNPVIPAEAKKIIAERWTVPEEIRKRRRSRKIAGKAPQAATTGPDRRGDPPHPRSSRPRAKTVKPAT